MRLTFTIQRFNPETDQRPHPEDYRLDIGRGMTVLEAIRAFEKVTGQKVNYEIGQRREGDVAEIWADTTKAGRELGWKAEKSLEDVMRSAWEWEKTLEKK